MELDEEWAEEANVSPVLRAKILCLKVCRNRSLAHASSDTALEITTPVLRMLVTMLDFAGSLSAESDDE
jgi:sister-chromatid-cohesion protein PDS5